VLFYYTLLLQCAMSIFCLATSMHFSLTKCNEKSYPVDLSVS